MGDGGDTRITAHPVLGPPPERRRITFSFDGQLLTGYEGEPVGFALLAHGIRSLRHSGMGGEARGLLCGVGHCMECRVTVDGVPNQRACLVPVRDGMRVERPDAVPRPSWPPSGGRESEGLSHAR